MSGLKWYQKVLLVLYVILISPLVIPFFIVNGICVLLHLPKNKTAFLTRHDEDAFQNEDSPLKRILPQNAQELYDMMLQTPELCGKFELTHGGNSIVWYLYENIKLEIGVDPRDCYFGVDKMLFGKVEGAITHWHPTMFEIYDEVCRIGKRGNVLVIRSTWFGADVLYMGKKADCPYSPDKRYLLGKLYYLEAK